MEVRQIIVNSHDDEGFKVVHEYGEWKVGILNYNERFSKFKELENKYSKKIGKLLDKMKNNTMEELWVELDKLKDKMQKEMNEIGIK